MSNDKSSSSNLGLRTRKRRPDPLLGATIAGKYKIVDKLGEGGMGTVYRAMQQPIDRQVAVKVLLNKLVDDDMAIRRFDQEARAVSKMQHPNTVTIYDYGQTDDGRFYLVMEFLKGKTLTDLLREEGPLGAHITCHIIRQVCASLGEAHMAGIIHRDLKPDNIFLTKVGSDDNFVKVLDFGVAKLADNEAGATLTQTGMIFGTPKYMSPEQAEGKPIDFRADIYAIGVVMYELLAGRPPFLADTAVALLLKHISQPPPTFEKIRSDLKVPARLEAITMKALAKDVDQRYDSVEALGEDLYQCMSSMSTGPLPVVGMSTQPVPVSGSIPTEMVPNQGAPVSSGVASPKAVPDNLSLGVNPADAAGQTGPRMGAAATEQSPLLQAATQPAPIPETGNAATEAVAVTPVTENPTAASLAPSEELFLDAAGRKKSSSRSMLYSGAALLAVAAGIIAFIQLRSPPTTTVPLPPTPGQETKLAPAADPKEDSVKPKPNPGADTKTPVPKAEEKPKRITRPGNKDRRSDNKGNQRAKNTTPKPVPERVESRTEPKRSQKVRFKFSSNPSGAMVTLDGRQLGKTPFNIEFAKEMVPVEFKFSLKGYQTKTVEASLGRDRDINSELVKKKKAPVVRPKPKPQVNEVERTKPDSDRIDDSDPLNERVDELKDF